MSRVLVTGSAGFLGRHLCRLVKERGDEPFGLDLRASGGDFEEAEGSVTDPDLWARLPQVDGVIHAAALTDLWHRDPRAFARVNTQGSRLAARFAAAGGIPFVYVSSYTVLMAKGIRQETVLDGTETMPSSRLHGPYARSKREAELAVGEILPAAAVVLPTAPIGPGDHALTPPMRMTRDVSGRRLPGMMRGRINIVDVRDVAGACLAALGREGGRYLLSGYDLSLTAFARLAAEEAGVPPLRLEVPPQVALLAARAGALGSRLTGRPPGAPLDGVRMARLPVRFEARRAREELGFAPRPLADTLADAVAFLRQEGFLAG